MEDKVVISLISVVVGWVLAQGTSIMKDLLNTRKLKAGLLNELQDIEDQLQRVVMIHGRQLQIFGKKGMEPSASLPIHNMFFKQYYKDVFSQLNREQRLSYQLIHATLDNLNDKNQNLAKLFEETCKELKETQDQDQIGKAIDLWGQHVITIYKTAMDVRFHVQYHLKNPKKPSFDIMGPMHKSYLKYNQEMDKDIKSIIEKAGSLKREDFEKIHDEELFDKQKPNTS